MMKHFIKFFLLIFLLGIHQVTIAQTARQYIKAAEEAFANKSYYTALQYYQEALSIKTTDAVSYQAGLSAYHYKDYDLAIKHLIPFSDKKIFPKANYYLARTYHSKGDYEQAIFYYKKCTSNDEINARINACEWARVQTSVNGISLTPFPEKINTAYSEFGGILLGDTLYYAATKYLENQEKPDTDIYYFYNNKKSKNISRINSSEAHEANVFFYKDKIYFTRCEALDAITYRCDIWFAKKTSKGWDTPTKLPANLNDVRYTTTHPMIVASSPNDLLYFTSDRVGGHGKLDIWCIELDKEGLPLGDPKNLAINSPQDDVTPFYYAPSDNLYFSSNRLEGFGGFDTYRVSLSESSPQVPVNLGIPLNSSYDDYYLTIKENGLSGVITSNRTSEGAACCNDLFQVNVTLQTETEINIDSLPIIDSLGLVMEGEQEDIPKDSFNFEEEIPVTIFEEESNVFPVVVLYFDNDEPDKRTLKNITQKSYDETYFLYLKRKPDFITKNQDIEGVIEAFFDNKVTKGYSDLERFKQKILPILIEGNTLTLLVEGFTSPRAKTDYNFRLGGRRVDSGINSFVKDARFVEYIKNGKLLFERKSLGEKTAPDYISDLIQEEVLSIYSVEASLERRIQLSLLKIN